MNAEAKGPRITARSFYRALLSYGYDRGQILHVVNELVELIIHSVRNDKHAPGLVSAAASSEEETPDGVAAASTGSGS